MKIKKKKLQYILDELADLVEFAEHQEKSVLLDVAYDPHINIVRCTDLLDEMIPNWRKRYDECALLGRKDDELDRK